MDEESPPLRKFQLPESVRSLMFLLEQAGMERELANLKESYLKGIKPLTSYDELQRELVLLERSDLPFTRRRVQHSLEALNKESTFMVSFENLATSRQLNLISSRTTSRRFVHKSRAHRIEEHQRR